jgi:putative transposase
MAKFKDKYRVESARLRGWDYASAGWYFVTICTHQRACVFGRVVDGNVELSPLGEIACQYWVEIPAHTSGIETDAFTIMPNHMHGIIVIPEHPDPVETQHAASLQTLSATSLPPDPMSAISLKAGSLSAVVRSYKSAVTRWAGLNGYDSFAWQARFHDHIICDEPELNRIRRYIHDNPLKWTLDDLYTES